MTATYAYFDDTTSGSARGEIWQEESFQDYIEGTGRERQMKSVTDPLTDEHSTKMVQIDNSGSAVSIRCAPFHDHATKDERAYLIVDTESTSSIFSLNNNAYTKLSKQILHGFEIKTQEELETLGFVFDIEEI